MLSILFYHMIPIRPITYNIPGTPTFRNFIRPKLVNLFIIWCIEQEDAAV